MSSLDNKLQYLVNIQERFLNFRHNCFVLLSKQETIMLLYKAKMHVTTDKTTQCYIRLYIVCSCHCFGSSPKNTEVNELVKSQ